ncbi:MAG: hypothetical protein H8E13_12220 [Actinobacteria bacterium]|nr:hypothetical protein [Actinomycetota bacterium]
MKKSELRKIIKEELKKIKEITIKDALDKYIKNAEKSIIELFNQVSTGYGEGSGIGIVADVLKNTIPKKFYNFLSDAIKKADGKYK